MRGSRSARTSRAGSASRTPSSPGGSRSRNRARDAGAAHVGRRAAGSGDAGRPAEQPGSLTAPGRGGRGDHPPDERRPDPEPFRGPQDGLCDLGVTRDPGLRDRSESNQETDSLGRLLGQRADGAVDHRRRPPRGSEIECRPAGKLRFTRLPTHEKSRADSIASVPEQEIEQRRGAMLAVTERLISGDYLLPCGRRNTRRSPLR